VGGAAEPGLLSARAPTATTAVRPVSGADLSPPVVPNLVRERAVASARAVGRNTVETLLFRSLSTPVALLLVVIQGRFLRPEGRGAYVLAVLTVTIATRLLGQLGIAVTNRLQDPAADVRGLVQRALAIGVLLGGLGVAAVCAWGSLTGELELDVAVAASLALVPNVVWQTLSGVLMGLGRIRLWNYVQLASPLLTLAGMLTFVVWLDGEVVAALLAWALANALTALLALTAARDLWLPLRLPPIGDELGRAIARLALVMGAVQIVNLVSYRVELFILRYFKGLADVGVYSIAMQTVESMWLIAAAMATAVTAPAVQTGEHEAAGLIARTALKALLYTAAAAGAVAAAGPFVIPLVLGEAFEDAALPLALLMPGVAAYAPVTVLVVYLSVRRGRPRLSLAVSACAGVTTLGLGVILIPPLGVNGAAAASSAGYVAGAVLAWAFFARLRRPPAGRGSPEATGTGAG
jgi:O-antigen/teichoic acid export membrane protein